MLHIHEDPNLNLGALLGAGAYASVYKGTYKNGQEVAVKKRFDQQRSFAEEAELMASLSRHANLISLVTQYIDGFSMTLVDGMQLHFHLNHYLPNFDRRLQISKGILNGVMELHANNITHADLKPHNIMVTAAGHPVICDFGMAKRHIAPLILSQPSGTPVYMAPEMIRNRYLSKAVDLYALGLIFWLLQSGLEPFDEVPTQKSLFKQVLQNVRPDLDDVPFQCLAFTLVVFYLWRPQANHRMPLVHALQIVEAIIADLEAQLKETSIVATIDRFAFFKRPIDVLMHAMMDGNHVIVEKLMRDPQFSVDWLNKPIGQQILPLAALRNGQSAIALEMLTHPGITKQQLMIADALSPNGILATALKMNAFEVFETILANPNCDAEVFSALFTSVANVTNETQKKPEWLAIAAMSKATLLRKNISEELLNAIRSIFSHPHCVAKNLGILSVFNPIPQDSILWESNYVKAYVHLHQFAKMTQNCMIKILLRGQLDATGFCMEIVENIQHHPSTQADPNSQEFICLRKAVAAAELFLQEAVAAPAPSIN